MNFLRRMTRFLWALCFLLGGALIFVFIFPEKDEIVDVSKSEESVVNAVEIDVSRLSQSSFEDYEKIFLKREMFKSVIKFSSKERNQEKQQSSTNITDSLLEKYRIVGIVIDQNSEVIFEDLETKETFFLSSGGKLGEATVKEILPGKVILTLGDNVVAMTP